jgi:hypothetical protein
VPPTAAAAVALTLGGRCLSSLPFVSLSL